MIVAKASGRFVWAGALAFSLMGGCATEIQEPVETNEGLGPSGSGGSSSGAGGADGHAGAGGSATPSTAGSETTEKGGASGSAAGGMTNAGSAGLGGAGGASADGGVGGGSKGGAGGGAGSGGKGGAGGSGGAGGKGGAGGSGGGTAMPNPCGTTKLKIQSATASSEENAVFTADKAIDGDPLTRWGSAETEPQWIYADLGEVAHVSRVRISWENAFASNYRIEIAQAAAGPWTLMLQETAGDGLIDDLTTLKAGNGRFVRMYGTTRGTIYGFSLYELEVYGDLDEKCQ
jgi:hypothetical protein